MSLTIPLSVSLETSRMVTQVTRQVRDLSFRSAIPGGFASANISLDRPLSLQPGEIAYYGRLRITDGRHGGVVWEGRLEDPGRSAGVDGQVWDLTAIGPAGHARDITAPLVYAYRDLTHWQRTAATKAAGRISEDEHTDGSPALLLGALSGTWSSPDSVRATSKWVQQAGQRLARVNWQMVGGAGSSQWLMEGHVWLGLGSPVLVRQNILTAFVQGLSNKRVTTDWTHPKDRLELRLAADAAGLAGGETRWARFWDLRVRTILMDTAGSEITTASFYATDEVPVEDIIRDLLGRRLPQFDGPNAEVGQLGESLDQLAYPDGVDAAGVLEELMGLYPDWYWAAWESGAGGLYRFEWAQWPAEVRYEADLGDGYTAAGSAEGLYNAVNVRFRDQGGTISIFRFTSTVPALDDAGLTREATLDLGEAGSAAAAITAGNNFLADHQAPPNAGRLTVARPVRDLVAGRTVAPWEIRPGALLRVRGILPRTDALNATARDGVGVFRVVAVEFRASDAAVTLELDSPAPSIARAVADLQAQRR
jgi:hypothetical protein